jgi:hypothetical protein
MPVSLGSGNVRCVTLAALVVVAAVASADDRSSTSAGQSPPLWSFQPLAPPPVPTVMDASWPRDDIDRFVLSGIEQAGLSPNPDADRITLIRRAAFDLTGLPPTQREVADFLADPSGDDRAFAKVVDHYLASPHFGERWGRHWLDIVRYADSTGRAWNAPFTYAWRYRDYVIDSFNQDKPLDRFVLEQIAGDLLPADTIQEERENQIATGMLALGALDLQALSHEQFLLDRIDDQIDVVTRSLLGLSIACARCHDHKYDPVTIRDYYALAGIFQSTETLAGVAHQRQFGREGYVHPSKLLTLSPLSPRSRSMWPNRGIHSMSDYQDEWRSGQRDIRFDTDPNLAMGVREGEPGDCAIRVKGEQYDRGEAPPRGDVRIPGLPPLPKIADRESGRMQLARWLVSDEQPLTARVMANRVWQHLFGAGIVRTVDDFGANAEPPTNPELLDHVALRFRDGGWSFKKLIRAIVLSRTYRLSSAGQAAALAKDPQNTLHWRMNRRRLEIEAIRDALLDAAGLLTDERPPGIQVAGIGGKNRRSQVHSLLPFDAPYRTVYLPVIRAGLPEEFTTFDFPDPCLLQGQREVTTVAPQALFFLNSPFVVDCSREAARRLLREAADDDRGRIERAYQLVLRRVPTAEETAAARALLRSLEPPADADADEYRYATLIQGLFASAEFRYVR